MNHDNIVTLVWNAFDMHKSLNEHGTMKIPKWDATRSTGSP